MITKTKLKHVISITRHENSYYVTDSSLLLQLLSENVTSVGPIHSVVGCLAVLQLYLLDSLSDLEIGFLDHLIIMLPSVAVGSGNIFP